MSRTSTSGAFSIRGQSCNWLLCRFLRGELDGEIHAEADQFFHIEQGRGLIIADAMTHEVKPGDCAVVTVGAYHNLF